MNWNISETGKYIEFSDDSTLNIKINEKRPGGPNFWKIHLKFWNRFAAPSLFRTPCHQYLKSPIFELALANFFSPFFMTILMPSSNKAESTTKSNLDEVNVHHHSVYGRIEAR